MALADGLAAATSGFAAALGLGLGSSSGFAFAEALLIGTEAGAAETGKGLTLLFAKVALVALVALADLAAALLLLALAGTLTLLLDFVLAMTKTHQKGFNPS
jgi:hypothetical protein